LTAPVEFLVVTRLFAASYVLLYLDLHITYAERPRFNWMEH
jgi:ABC-type transporter Mla maintaining outer membrane lipid asymmetry permease subunit MlaE